MPEPEQAATTHFRRNLGTLFFLQASSSTASVILASVNGLAGLRLAPSGALATLPVASFVVGAALSSYFASLFMARYGRQRGFQLGAFMALLGAAACAYAVQHELFPLLCAGSAIVGAYAAMSQYHRFAAAEAAPLDLQSRAISWVLAGGVVGAVLGPESTKLTKDLTSTLFVGCYLSISLIACVALAATTFLALPPVAATSSTGPPVKPAQLLRRLDVATAVLTSVVGYAVMIFLMTATPLAMARHHHAYNDTALVIEWHVLGMFAPSFVTGSLIRRFGVLQIILAGVLLMALCVAVNFLGISLAHFWVALLLLGVGWNFMFIGGTTLLTQSSAASERSAAQGTNELLTHGANACSSLSAGLFLHQAGWQAMNLLSLPFLLIVAVLCLRLLRREGVR